MEIIIIKWNDCRTWDGPSMPHDIPPSIIGHTVGFLVKETETDYYVALERFDKETHPDWFFRHVSVLPKCQVLEAHKWDEGYPTQPTTDDPLAEFRKQLTSEERAEHRKWKRKAAKRER